MNIFNSIFIRPALTLAFFESNVAKTRCGEAITYKRAEMALKSSEFYQFCAISATEEVTSALYKA